MIGVLLLTPQENGKIKMRQVAVRQSTQRQGVGRQLVAFAEQYALENGFCEMLLHARQVAMDFYCKLGYEAVGDEFLEVNIPHYKMRKSL
jgi:predicted GNAT family N-acyltransferase